MFDKYEALICTICNHEFTGRRPDESCIIVCPSCLIINELPVISEGDAPPDTVENEIEGGNGEHE